MMVNILSMRKEALKIEAIILAKYSHLWKVKIKVMFNTQIQTIKDEFYAVAFRKKPYRTIVLVNNSNRIC